MAVPPGSIKHVSASTRRPRPRTATLLLPAVLFVAVVATSSCGGDHDVFAGDGKGGREIASVGWFMIITATVIAAVFLSLLIWALVRGGRRPAWRETPVVLAGGVALPVAVILVLTVLTLGTLDRRGGDGALRVDVIAHQYWWEIRYPDSGVVTANEMRIPVGRSVTLTLTSGDVIHSFWVPSLDGKIDMVPGHTNHLTLVAEQPGIYRGQCAEYCGLQHALMSLSVEATSTAEFERWLQHEASDAREPTSTSERVGAAAFSQLPCASCHTIRGTGATGDLGPDLTHLAGRRTLAAGAIPNDRGHLGGWIANSQTIKPGNLMPPIPMDPAQLTGLLDYLQSLR